MAQIYAVGVDMERPYNVYCGMQDFGSWKGPSTKKGRFPIRFEDWEHVNGGDGFYNQVDPQGARWLYSGPFTQKAIPAITTSSTRPAALSGATIYRSVSRLTPAPTP